ncbi:MULTISPECIES: hypothetical protein [Amycolatopsis]|uniref:hypothetical protein n=1 Tax=Amycolatopsis TaxID=1813 RepID=UPI0014308B59|nr:MULTISPECIES: hypothetical protein [Amycolatopsis]MCG3754306.1 hypothetical protein [Amycolatopsis sp. Poz14]
MPTQSINDWKSAAHESGSHPAGLGFGELGQEDLAEARTAALPSSGYICTFTFECNC